MTPGSGSYGGQVGAGYEGFAGGVVSTTGGAVVVVEVVGATVEVVGGSVVVVGANVVRGGAVSATVSGTVDANAAVVEAATCPDASEHAATVATRVNARQTLPGTVPPRTTGAGCTVRTRRATPARLGGVSIRLRRPSADALRELLRDGHSQALTYEPVGLSAQPVAPAGYRMGRYSRAIGQGERVFGIAVEALKRWRVHEGSGLFVVAEGPPAVDAVVAMAAPMPIGFIDVVCRVVDVVDQPDCYGFTYGTLAAHPEQGEESFTVVRDAAGDVKFHVVAVSRPRHPLSRVFAPIARRLQRAATIRYLDAMQAAVADG